MSRSGPRPSQEPEPDDPAAPVGAVVTGVGQPLGWALARALVPLGYAVHVTDPDGGVAARAAAELGAPAIGSALDVRSLPACRAAASRTRRRFGSLGVWVNALALADAAPAWELDERTRQRMLDVNLVGTVNGTLAALEVMRPVERGDVINVFELSALLPLSGQAVYSAARHGAIAFSLGTLADLRATGLPCVNVSCLLPSGRVAGGASPRLAVAMAELLDHPRPILAVPRWRGALVRTRWLRPSSGALNSGWLSALAVPGEGRRRRRGRQR